MEKEQQAYGWSAGHQNLWNQLLQYPPDEIGEIICYFRHIEECANRIRSARSELRGRHSDSYDRLLQAALQEVLDHARLVPPLKYIQGAEQDEAALRVKPWIVKIFESDLSWMDRP